MGELGPGGATAPGKVTDYQPHVDGLRAIAIVAVVAYHIGIPGFGGGFVGVDVFFVISGYLIIGQIASGLKAERFSLTGFYARRTLRILPPFLLVLLACAAAAPFLMFAAKDFISLENSSWTAPVMLSNFYFKASVNYFDVRADLKPLLHTWTLSVEEQFYLVAPLFLMGFFRIDRRRFGWRSGLAAAAMFAVSLAGMLTIADRGAAFYYPQWRAWEFLAGGVVAVVGVGKAGRVPRLVLEAVALAGLAAIIAAVVLTDAASHPSAMTMLPVFGAAALILAGFAEPRLLAARLLASPPFVATGLVSYAWYLWHWPLLSFGHMANFGEADFATDVILGGPVAFLLAVGTYFLVERPTRRWRKTVGRTYRPGWIVGVGAAAAVAVAVIGGGLGALQALVARNAPSILAEGLEPADCPFEAGEPNSRACLAEAAGVVLGDSHAGVLYDALAGQLAAEDAPVVPIIQQGCDLVRFAELREHKRLALACTEVRKGLDKLARYRGGRLPFVVVVSRWLLYGPRRTEAQFAAGFADLIVQLRERFDRILVVGPFPEFARAGIACVGLADRYGLGRESCDIARAAVERRRAGKVEAMVRIAAGFPDVRLVDPIDIYCDTETCRVYSDDRVYFNDDNHVTRAGAGLVRERFAADLAWAAGAGGVAPVAAEDPAALVE